MSTRFMQELDAEWHEFWTHLPGHHHDTSAETAAATATIEPTTGGPVSLSQDLHNFAAKLEHFDDEALTALDAIKRNPATAAGFTLLRDLTGFNVDPGLIDIALAGGHALRDRLAAAAASAAEPSFTPAGPRVAGQA